MTLCHVCQVSKFRIWRYPIMSCLHVNLIFCQIKHLILELLSSSTFVNITGGPDLRIADHWQLVRMRDQSGTRTEDKWPITSRHSGIQRNFLPCPSDRRTPVVTRRPTEKLVSVINISYSHQYQRIWPTAQNPAKPQWRCVTQKRSKKWPAMKMSIVQGMYNIVIVQKSPSSLITRPTVQLCQAQSIE